MKKKHFTIPIFIPELACPHQCVFCNQRKISGTLKAPTTEEAKQTIEKYLQTLPSNGAEIEIGFLGGNFTGIPIEDQEQYLQIASPYVRSGLVEGIRISTRPDYINNEVVKLLKKHHVTTVELGAQSMHDDVLQKSGRGHTVKDIEQAAALIKGAEISLGLQMMIGLPGDTAEKSLQTAKKIIALKADNSRIYPSLVIRDTAMEQLWLEGSYKALSLEQAIQWAKPVYLALEEAGIDIIRVGLHPSEGLMNGHDLRDGPFHISFRELVLSSIWSDLFNNYSFDQSAQSLQVFVSSSEINYAIGYHAVNKNKLRTIFKNVKFIAVSQLKNRDFYVDYCG